MGEGEVGTRRTTEQARSGLRSLVTRLSQITCRARGTPWLWLALGALLLLLIGAAMDWGLHARIRDKVRDRLQILQRNNVRALQHWAQDQSRFVAALVELPELSQGLHDVVRPGLQPAERLEAGRPLATQLAPLIKRLGRRAWLVLDREGEGVLQDGRLRFVDLPLHRLAGAIEAVEHGARVGAPFVIDDDLRARGFPGDGPKMWVWAPIKASTGRTLGLFGLGLDMNTDFAPQLRTGVTHGTVETYAFDARGLMLSGSRFDAELEALGLLQKTQGSALHVSLRDPGGNLLAGHRPEVPRDEQPLTRAVRAASAGKEGLDLTGYRDYRGVEVVGAWSWLSELGLGVVTEVNLDEAFDVLFSLRRGLWLLWSLLVVAALAALFYSSRATALVREVEAAAELGQYKLLEKLGEGGMGVVYRARHALLARPTAVKVLRAGVADPELSARFEREVRTTAELTHPNTIAIYDFGRTPDGTFYYAMEYLEGLDLDRLVDRHGPQPYARVLRVLLQAAGSLAEAHARGFIHRDIKPANLMLSVRGGEADFVKVLDFGLVRTLGRAETKITRDDRVMGTPLYMAPEALTDPETLDPRADLYALGAVGYFLLTGEDAFGADSNPEVITRHLVASYKRLDQLPDVNIPEDVVALIHRCLARDREQRPASAEVLRDELERLSARHPWTREDAASWWASYGPEERVVEESRVTKLSIAPDRAKTARV